MKQQYWENLTKAKWEKVTFPYRPRPVDLTFLDGVDKNKKVIIFGATPEIRSFFSKRRQPVTIFDSSKKCVDEMGYFVEDVSLETYIYGNWLTHHVEEKYDYIIGDLVFNIINKADHKKLNATIERIKKPTTKVFFRTLSKNDTLLFFVQTKNIAMLFLYLSCINNTINLRIFKFLNKLFSSTDKSTQIVFLK